MTHHTQSNALDQIGELLAEHGFDGMTQALTVLLNEVMKLERAHALGAGPYERAEGRQGHANGFKPKTVQTRMGPITLAVPQARGLSFLGRMHRRPESAEPGAAMREAMAWRWWLWHRRMPCSDPPIHLIRAVGRDRELGGSGRASYDRVSLAVGGTFRAGGAVECLNSVPRMQQSRHKRTTQAMLDLKRPYWNSRAFRGGPRESLPVRDPGPGSAHVRLLGAAPGRAERSDAKTVNCWKCRMRQSRQPGGRDSHATRTMHAPGR